MTSPLRVVETDHAVDSTIGDDGSLELVAGIVSDTRVLVTAHVEALRDDLHHRLATLGSMVRMTIVATSVVIVTSLIIGLAIASTLVTYTGLPVWAALWIVGGGLLALGGYLVLRIHRAARAATHPLQEI